MNILKNNIKLIILIIILVIISSGISVFATYNYLASDIKYTDNKSVSDALNELYNQYKNLGSISIYSQDSVANTTTENRLITENLTKGKYLLACNEYNANTPDPGTSVIVSSENEDVNINKKTDIKSTGAESASYGATSYISVYEIEANSDCIIKIIGSDGRTRTDVAGGINYIFLKIN